MATTTVIVLDNSEWMRNGDFTPTRIEQEFEAFSRLCDAKMRHPESMVGLMTMSGKAPKVLVTPSVDNGKLRGSVHGQVRFEGEANVVAALQIAQLALKHRPHKNHPPRIILFVASPIREEEAKLVKLGTQLQKNEVAVDIINFGEEQDNTSKLEAFLKAVNKNDNSHLVSIPPGGFGTLADILSQSPIIAGDGGSGGDGGNLNEFGVDPELDPELAMAMAMSMEEARRAEEGGGGDTTATGGTEPGAPAPAAAPGFDIDAEDAELQAALALSMADSEPASEDVVMKDAEEKTEEASATATEPEAAADPADMYSDPSFLADVIGELEGVDPNDPEVKAMMEGLTDDSNKDDDKKDDK
jgi:26S proteasome regulatory subunit N10